MSVPNIRATETHVSWVIFTPERVYKIKRPVQYGFIDLRDVDERTRVCRNEVDLNRRLAPDVYEGLGQFVGPDGVAEPVVVMRHMPEDRRLSTLVSAGASEFDAYVDRVAEVLADFHRRAGRGDDVIRDSEPPAIRQLWRDNLDELRSLDSGLVERSLLDEIAAMSQSYLAGRTALFTARIEGGRAVDGHGDLLADDIFCLDDGPRILDCLEFDDRLRHGDAVLDIAMLAMDLERLGRADLADRLVSTYRTASGDEWPESLTHFYIAYRATVRAKVSAIRAGSGDTAAAGQARGLLELGARHLRTGAVRLVLVGGLPGTGKSTLAGELQRITGWRLLRSDTVRQELAGSTALPGGGEFGAGRYAPEVTAAVYAELCRRSAPLLAGGYSVILDATWSSRDQREVARSVADAAHAAFVALRCEAPQELAAERIVTRLRQGHDPSEATPAVARSLALAADAWPEATAVDTSGDVQRAAGAALQSAGYPVSGPAAC